MDQELKLNTWVLLGNTLNAVLRGPQQVALADEELRVRLLALEATLAPVTPEGMVDAVQALTVSDRMLLHDLCVACFDRLGEEAATLVGVDRATGEPVLALLQGR
ncbi:hypothetical protein Terro_0237 [Terriglobus roseus DSM 18391]|uniref:Uncharacterized protein n=1 Tax=Terriglobus roseus (strain DSM 18391 / NRRL B-41598 / KBS 63) TaxID=926566 RepID=I3ZBG8_TERRK|nr:hypothetical protein [Terriglobus roseus]AFL86586.1 hypothetical protein Terro_0237 [Terriglobus roseus DSM 18391]